MKPFAFLINLIIASLMLANIASASENDWRIGIRADNSAGERFGITTHIGVHPSATDTVDNQDQDAALAMDAGLATRWVVSVMQGNTSTWTRDIYSSVSPATYPNQTKTWYLRVAALPDSSNQPIRLAFSSVAPSLLPPLNINGQPIRYKLTMVNNRGISGTPENGITWDLPMPVSHNANPVFWTFPTNLPVLKLSAPTHEAMIAEGYIFALQQVYPAPPPAVATPVFNPNGGTYTSMQIVSISCATPESVIRYTTNGSEPTENDPIIASGSATLINQSTTLKAKAWKTGYTPSAVQSATYTINLDTSDDIIGLSGSGSIWYTTDKSSWRKLSGSLTHLAIGDFNGDGVDDIAGSGSNYSIWYTINRINWAKISGNLSNLTTGDFDGDGRDDLAGIGSSNSIWYTTNMKSWKKIPGRLLSLAVGDVNGDGEDDLIGTSSNHAVWYTTNKTNWTNIPGSLSGIISGDFNGDGLDDIAGLDVNKAILYTTDKLNWTKILASSGTSYMISGDFNADGSDDIAAVTAKGEIKYTTNKTSWMKLPGKLSSLIVGDFNGDGCDDIAGLSANGSIYYTTNKTSWTKISGSLSSIYRIRW